MPEGMKLAANLGLWSSVFKATLELYLWEQVPSLFILTLLSSNQSLSAVIPTIKALVSVLTCILQPKCIIKHFFFFLSVDNLYLLCSVSFIHTHNSCISLDGTAFALHFLIFLDISHFLWLLFIPSLSFPLLPTLLLYLAGTLFSCRLLSLPIYLLFLNWTCISERWIVSQVRVYSLLLFFDTYSRSPIRTVNYIGVSVFVSFFTSWAEKDME